MGRLTKYLIFAATAIVLLGLVWFWGYRSSLSKNHVTVSSDILLESVRNVIKLGTIEGNFIQFYRHESYKHYDISMLRKKAFIRVKAKVLVGFNMDSLKIDIDHAARKIVIGNIPNAEILSIDHSLYYFDIDEGIFNSFSREDYNKFQSATKEKIRIKAADSDLILRAEKELRQHLGVFEKILRDSGWDLEFKFQREESILLS